MRPALVTAMKLDRRVGGASSIRSPLERLLRHIPKDARGPQEERCLVFEEEDSSEELVKWWSVEFPAEDVRKA